MKKKSDRLESNSLRPPEFDFYIFLRESLWRIIPPIVLETFMNRYGYLSLAFLAAVLPVDALSAPAEWPWSDVRVLDGQPGEYFRLRADRGEADVLFAGFAGWGGADWRWRIDSGVMEQVTPNGTYSKEAEAGPRYSAAATHAAFMLFYDFVTGDYWTLSDHDAPPVVDGDIAAWQTHDKTFFYDMSQRRFAGELSLTGLMALSGNWGALLERDGPRSTVSIINLTSHAITQLTGERNEDPDIQGNFVAYVSYRREIVIELHPGHTVVRSIEVPAPCSSVRNPRLFGSTGGWIAFEAHGCENDQDKLYIANYFSGDVFFVSELFPSRGPGGSRLGNRFDVEGDWVVFVNQDQKMIASRL